MKVKCKHQTRLYWQKDSLGNTHLISACEFCDKVLKFVPRYLADSVDYEIKVRISKAERKRNKNVNNLQLF